MGFESPKELVSWMDGMDRSPQTFTTTKALAVLKKSSVVKRLILKTYDWPLCGGSKAKEENLGDKDKERHAFLRV